MIAPPMKVLLIEDNRADAELVASYLEDKLAFAHTLLQVGRLSAGLKKLQKKPFDVILLDLMLPDSQGLATFHQVRAASKVPIVILTGVDDVQDALQAVRLGAQDYLLKGKTDGFLLARALLFAIQRAASSSPGAMVPNLQILEQIEEKLQKLTPREREVLEQIVQGRTLKQIALNHGTSYYTVKNQRACILEKMGGQSEADLVRMVLLSRLGIEAKTPK